MPGLSHPWVIILLPVCLLLWHRLRRRWPGIDLGLSGDMACFHPLGATLAPLEHRRRRPRHWIGMTMIGLALLALSGPVWIDDSTSAPETGRNIVLAIDVSGSMRALTGTGKNGSARSRLDLVREAARRLVNRRPWDRFGIVVFADEALTMLPMSQDTKLVGEILGELGQGIAGERTALGDGIALACRQLEQVDPRSRLLIVFSDGRNTSGNLSPAMALRLAKAAGVRIYSVGVGERGQVRFPRGPVLGDVLAELPPDTATLQHFAEATQGRFFPAHDPATLDGILARIERENPVPLEDRSTRTGRSIASWPLGALIALVLWQGWRQAWTVRP